MSNVTSFGSQSTVIDQVFRTDVSIFNQPTNFTCSALRFEIIKDLESAEKYWKMFSANENLFDNWEFRYCAYQYTAYELFFYVGFIGDEPVGVLPLQWNHHSNHLEYFGGWRFESNRPFIQKGYEKYIHNFFEGIDKNFFSGHMDIYIPGKSTLSDYTYYVNTSSLGSYTDFVETNFEGKSKRKFLREMRNFEKEHSIEIIRDRHSDMDFLFQYNLKNFGSDSDLITDPSESKFETNILNQFHSHLLTFVIDEQVQAVSLLIEYNNILFGINGGINFKDVYNLGKYVFCKKVDFAIEKKLSKYHAGVGSYNWKDKWHLDKSPQFSYSL